MSTIYQRKDGNWIYQYRENGKRHSIYLGKFPNKTMVKQRKAELDILYSSKKNIPAEKIPMIKLQHDYFNILTLRCSNKVHINNTKTRIKRFLDDSGIYYVNQITRQKIESFLHQRKLIGNSDTTIKNELTAIRGFTNWCIKNNYLNSAPTEGIKIAKTQKRPPNFLTKDQIQELLEKIEQYNPLKYMAYISLATGIRPTALKFMEWEDWNFERKILTIPKSKSRYWRTIPFNDALVDKLKPIVRKKGKCFNYAIIPPQKQMIRLKKELSFKFNYRELRHTYACQLLLNGTNIITVKELLGHESVKTTQIYLEALGMYKHNEVKNFNIFEK